MSVEQAIRDYIVIGLTEQQARLAANVGRWGKEPIPTYVIWLAGTGAPKRGGGCASRMIAAAPPAAQAG